MKQADLDKVSEIVARYGYLEWSLVGFTSSGDYKIFSYFTNPSVLPVFKIVLLSMLRQVQEYIEKYEGDFEEPVKQKGIC